MSSSSKCPLCCRPIVGEDHGCGSCGRAAIPGAVRNRAIELARGFADAHARDPWLRSAGLLSYSLRSRRRGFLDDNNQQFTRAALEFLWRLATLGGESGISPLAETAIREGLAVSQPVLAAAVRQLLDQNREALREPGDDFEVWQEQR